MSEDPLTAAMGEERDTSREHGGRPVEMLYALEGSRLILVTNKLPSHTELTALGFWATSRLFISELVYLRKMLQKNSEGRA